ncbi:MAG: membrane protein insertase YidC [Aquabacterium sp.]|uniref:membrane protein insertase YidC n=1 Tax=Aquabacterium sp. TaxID=1872578 RepID=UPI001B59828B|nr:membrane protein insertase YidC [Aquabacterium sp.]MBP7132207.1 membrane protein insertase YidC [Aquabacterium sp.]
MNDLRRTLLWSVFAVSLLMLWNGWLIHTGQPSLFAPAPATPAPESLGAASSSTLPSLSAAPGTPAAAVAAAEGASAPAVVPQSEQVTVTTDVVKATFDTLGGSLVKVELLQHRAQDDFGQNMVLLNKTADHIYVAESGLIASAGLPKHKTLFTLLSSERALADGADKLVVKMASVPVAGVQLIKTFTFQRGNYAIDVKQEVVNASAVAVNPSLYVQLVRDGAVPVAEGPTMIGAPQAYLGGAFYTGEAKFQKVEFAQIEKNEAEFQKSADNGWVAVVQHYFTAAWLNKHKTAREFYARKLDNNQYALGMLFPVGEVAPGQTKAIDTQLLVGPQEEVKLAELAEGLELVKDYGWTHLMAKPLFWLLNWLHSLIGNWGWSIVALVVLLKAAFYWLNASAYRSMGKMKALNPRIQAMRERLKDKPQEMQQQMLKIYREEKVNPIGGCLPILIQIPVFIALYWVLLSSVEMRNAPWIGWITDLSIKDPYFVLPALMTLSTLLQTWLNPTPPDPLQAKMMWIMPLLFSVMFFFFPAGLVLYWLTNNILSIAQQWMINRQLGVTK